ncbi:RHTO0S04e02916g1_1 [Rhodotorula toruloides]|uniref:Anaphase-promoting complex subunit 4 n=1 Tax=Rhodotorula toruloides TaxID=5286 RepID=A0A061APY3_RHOTO|nr:RHTO0S04e02916g1_1 [Rhodotorula toruloides]
MGGALQAVSTKTLPAASDLPANSLPPRASTSKLALLTSSPSAPDSKLALYRTSAAADLVWEWTPSPPPVDPSAGGPKPGGRLGLGLKGKGKAAQGAGGKIEQVVWSPTGTAIGTLVSPASASGPRNPSLALLSVQTGTPISPPIPLPAAAPANPPTSGSRSHLSWQALPSTAQPPDRLLTSFSLDLIRRLPALPKIAKETLPSAGDGAAPGPGIGLAGARIGGPGGSGGAGVFGAKQAMLERERAKEAQRALSMRSAIGEEGRFPRLAAMGGALVGTDAPEFGDEAVRAILRPQESGDGRAEDESVLCAGGADGAVHVFLGGSVYLGSIGVGGKVHAITAVPSSPDLAEPAISVLVHHSTSSTPLAVSRVDIPTPSTLPTVLHVSSTLSAHFEHAFEALQGARNMWDEARRIGKGWLQRIADVSRPHGVTTPPTTQLHLLLLTGRPTRSLHDFLASKMNERVLVKWEQAMGAALERLRKVAWMSVIPALERIVVMLKEVEAWSLWPDKFAPYSFSQVEVRQVICLACKAIAAMARMQREVEEEERCFKQFGAWLHFELDKVAQQEGSEIRPLANFFPLPVSHYVRHCLPATGSQISMYLSFGLATAPLSANGDLRAAEEWLNSRTAQSARSDQAVQRSSAESAGASLKEMLKRMAEELRGQVDASELEVRRLDQQLDLDIVAPVYTSSTDQDDKLSSDLQRDLPAPAFALAHPASALDPEYEARPPSRSTVDVTAAAHAESSPTQSIPVLLHLAVRSAAVLMDRAVRKATGDRASRSAAEGPDVGSATAIAVRTMLERDQRRHLIYELCVAGDTVYFSKRDPVGGSPVVQYVAHKLVTADGVSLRPMHFDFSGPQGVVFAFDRKSEGAAASPFLVTVDLAALKWEASLAPPGGPLPIASQYSLAEHFPPTALAFSRCTDDEPLVASLAAEGRRFEVLKLAANRADVDMQS